MASADPREEFIGEAITPEAGSFATTAMSRGEVYLRRHWFRVRVASGEEMTIYCDRQAKNTRRPKRRWWIYTIAPAAGQG